MRLGSQKETPVKLPANLWRMEPALLIWHQVTGKRLQPFVKYESGKGVLEWVITEGPVCYLLESGDDSRVTEGAAINRRVSSRFLFYGSQLSYTIKINRIHASGTNNISYVWQYRYSEKNFSKGWNRFYGWCLHSSISDVFMSSLSPKMLACCFWRLYELLVLLNSLQLFLKCYRHI